MSKEIYISSTPHETRLAIVETDELTEIYYERENEYTLAGSIYNGKVTRVLPGMQSSFVDIGLERDAFLYITDFMEEAGDAADFDSAEGRSRSDARRGDRSRDPQRDDTPAAAEPLSLDPTESRPSDRNESRSPDRNDRGDRGRRRRSGNRDLPEGQPRDSQPREPYVASESQSASDLSTPSTPTSFGLGATGSDAEIGEGAPGADGSRRWRGRRGRRRGRSGNRDIVASNQPATIPGQSDLADLPPDPSSGYDLEDSFSDIDLDASAAIPEPPPAVAQSFAPEPAAQVEQPLRSEPRDRDDRSRGGRSDDRGRRDRDGRNRDRRDDRPRAPRGFAPSRALYGVDEAADQQGEAGASPAEPIILPGEVLSKYRKDAAPAAGAPAAPATPPPAPDFVLPGSWDGGNVLPGETIRPRSSSPAPSGRDDRSRNRRDEGRGPGRQDRPNRQDRPDRQDRPNYQESRSESASPEPEASHSVASVIPALHASAPVEHDADGLTVAPPPEAEAALHEVAAETPLGQPEPAHTKHSQQAEEDHEPTEASASYRFDPAPPREFRQASPELSTPSDTESAEAPPESATIAHSITPPVGTPLAPIHIDELHPGDASAATPFGEPGSLSPAPAAHDLTSINPEGEMISHPPSPPPEGDIAEPTSPLQHETAILHGAGETQESSDSSPVEASPVAAPEVSQEADDLIVEELSHDAESETDEEDFHTTTLHAASIEEMDYDDEEETLEGAADLGTMLREMSIDEITQPAETNSAEDGEDDYAFEEEDTMEDSEFSASFPEISGRRDDHDLDSVDAHDSHDSDSEDHFAEEGSERELPQAAAGVSPAIPGDREDSRRRGGRRDGRRGGRDRDRGSDRNARSSSGNGDRDRSSGDRSSGSRPGRRDGHRSAQTTNLPAISDLLKPGQEVLVQIAKEPIAKKGARITSHIALPGRFLVFMPTVNHTGVSRKIESDSERRRLKEILLSEKGEASGGFIVRTAASGATEEELRSDLRFLLNLWADIKQRSESSKSPALIYHDLNLVERVLRDQVTDNFSAIWVDTESEYERVLRFLQRFQPSLIRRVKLYTKETPLFEQFGITEEINKALRSKVWLKSGGSIVINQTEALVAIDINTGKYVGKTARLEDTIVKTNLDAIPEIVRQIRLRDLGGIIIIDFIDMDERKNRHKVMAVLEEELKKDRAPSKVLQFNDFGLVAITRKRVKQSLERTLSTTCGICAGTGMVKSAVTVCNDIYIEMRKMQKHLDRGDVMLRVNPEVVKQLKSPTAKWLQEMEEMVGKTILVKSDPALHPEQFDIH